MDPGSWPTAPVQCPARRTGRWPAARPQDGDARQRAEGQPGGGSTPRRTSTGRRQRGSHTAPRWTTAHKYFPTQSISPHKRTPSPKSNRDPCERGASMSSSDRLVRGPGAGGGRARPAPSPHTAGHGLSAVSLKRFNRRDSQKVFLLPIRGHTHNLFSRLPTVYT